MPRAIPIPTTDPLSGQLTSICFNDEWAPYVYGVLKFLARPEYWGFDTQADVIQAIKWAETFFGALDFACSEDTVARFHCSQNLTTSDGGWALYSTFGTYGAGNGWQTVDVGADDYVFLGGPVFASAVNVVRIELDIDWITLGNGASPDVVRPYTLSGGSFSAVGGLDSAVQGMHTYVWDSIGTVSNIYFNLSGKTPGFAQITGFRIFNETAETGLACNG